MQAHINGGARLQRARHAILVVIAAEFVVFSTGQNHDEAVAFQTFLARHGNFPCEVSFFEAVGTRPRVNSPMARVECYDRRSHGIAHGSTR